MPTAFKRRLKIRLRGLTLVELLVVVAVVTLLSAVTLPTLRTVMTQRKTSQASILVKNMFEAARARAIARGRPVAVVLERLSSRMERNPVFNSGNAIAVNNFPLQSTIASNSDFVSNYALYNTCIRMSFAESPPPIEFDAVQFNLTGEYLTIGSAIAADSRFLQNVIAGSVLEFPSIPAVHRGVTITQFTGMDASGNFRFKIDNLPLYEAQYASPPRPVLPNYQNPQEFLGSMTANRLAIRPFIDPFPVRTTLPYALVPAASDFSSVTKMKVTTLPRPIASQIVEMPKGTCVDLSISGFGSDVRWTSQLVPVQSVINLRDGRRQFASDWLWADGTAAAPEPAPVSLRPVYIVFGPSGTVDSVIMNAISGGTGSVEIKKFDAQDDLYLFVGRTDQVLRMNAIPNNNMLTISGNGADGTPMNPEALDSMKLKANVNDSTAQWVRISPRSGTISVATVASAYETPFNGIAPTATSFSSPGELIGRSRILSFTDEATAQ